MLSYFYEVSILQQLNLFRLYDCKFNGASSPLLFLFFLLACTIRLVIFFRNTLVATPHQTNLIQFPLLLLFYIAVFFLLICFFLLLIFDYLLIFHFFSLKAILLIIIAKYIIKKVEKDQVFLHMDHNLPMSAMSFFCIHF